MSILVGGLPPRNSRNGAKASKWVRSQPYNVEVAARDNFTPENVMLDIASNGTSRVIGFLASNKAASVRVIRTIYANEPNDAILDKLTVNLSTPTDIVRELGGTDRATRKLKALKHPNAPLDLLIDNSPRTLFSKFAGIPYGITKKSWRGATRNYQRSFQQVVMLRSDFPIDLFAESLAFVSNPLETRVLYEARGREFVDYLNSVYGLSLTYTDISGIVRATMKCLPH